MSKSSGKVALYEVVNKKRFESAQQKAAAKGTDSKPCQINEQAATSKAEWKIKPKTVRFYPDRVELCLSWQVAIIAVLAVLAVMLVFFRLGQFRPAGKTDAVTSSEPVSGIREVMPKVKQPAVTAGTTERTTTKMVEPMGDNIIVITSYKLSSHLEPVKQYFAQYAIETEIVKSGSRYLLVTKQRFDNPQKAGTDGYNMKKKIMNIGANYKPPSGSGFESFGTKPFQDAYGMKVKN